VQSLRDSRTMEPDGPTTPRFVVRSCLDGHAPELEALLASPTTGGIQLARRSADIMDALLRALYVAAVDKLSTTIP
jgi:hypothetical protein